ncbi:uncharacterized protein LOC111294419 [Durio zibethinus]|uniref:Uncharacterized protein LOC111294419 n=1 Tax=Durio zibethinus TaxID=66656 RepID=A0A6P5YSB4_DURZI|nr:uncharacterized protein LOC111294419 [Durio zibethinus]
MKYIYVLVFLVILGIVGFNGVDGEGACGKHNIEKEAEKLSPCYNSSTRCESSSSNHCCTVMEKKLKNISYLCAIMLSRTADNARIKPQVAVTLLKRCNIAVRPVDHKCGAFLLI